MDMDIDADIDIHIHLHSHIDAVIIAAKVQKVFSY